MSQERESMFVGQHTIKARVTYGWINTLNGTCSCHGEDWSEHAREEWRRGYAHLRRCRVSGHGHTVRERATAWAHAALVRLGYDWLRRLHVERPNRPMMVRMIP